VFFTQFRGKDFTQESRAFLFVSQVALLVASIATRTTGFTWSKRLIELLISAIDCESSTMDGPKWCGSLEASRPTKTLNLFGQNFSLLDFVHHLPRLVFGKLMGCGGSLASRLILKTLFKGLVPN